jgi:hypothetical protein
VAKVSENVGSLVEPYSHREELSPIAARLQGTRFYTQAFPSLLDQLREALHPGVDGEEKGRLAFGSKSPAMDEALDVLVRIESGAVAWLKLSFGRSPRGTVEANLRALVGAATEPGRPDAQLSMLAGDTSRWLVWARTESGWQARPLTIPDRSPCCGNARTIRVRRPDASFAWCLRCGQAWSETDPDLPSVLLLEVALLRQRANENPR